MDTRPRIRPCRARWTRAIACVLVVCLLLGSRPAPAGAQYNDGVVDAERYSNDMLLTIFSTLIALKVAPLAPVVLIGGLAYTWYIQANIWAAVSVYDEAIVRAWTTENLLALDYGLRSALSVGPDYIRKLVEDRETLKKGVFDAQVEINNKRLTGPDEVAAKDALELKAASLEAVTEKLAWAEKTLPDLTAKCEALIGGPDKGEGAFGALRRRFLDVQPRRDLTQEERARFAGWNGTIKMFTRDTLSAQSAMAIALSEYVKAAAQFYATLVEPVDVFVTTSRGSNSRKIAPTASQHLRVQVSNESEDLLFWVKVVPRPDSAPPTAMRDVPPPPCGLEPGAGQEALFRQREIRARRGWMPLFPKGTGVRLNVNDLKELGRPPAAPGQAGPVGGGAEQAAEVTPVDVQFPSSIWFPVEPGDRVELRVATFKEFRRQIRFLNLNGYSLRPEIFSVRRNFYYLGYEMANAFKPSPTRLYAIAENYQWGNWEGAWKEDLRPEPVTTTNADFYEAPSWVNPNVPVPAGMNKNSHTLTVSGDHYAWSVPDTPEGRQKLDKDPFMRVKVSGSAQFVRHVNAAAMTTKPNDKLFERSDGGTLSVNVEPW